MTRSVFTKKHEQFRLRLVEARKSAGLTQAELANKLFRPQSFVSKVERGERRLDVIEFLEVAQALGIDPFEFLRLVNDGKPVGGTGRRENRSRRDSH